MSGGFIPLDAPAPPYPADINPEDIDIRGFATMPIDGFKLMASDLWNQFGGDVFKAAFALWWASWNQVPAASLPTDEAGLASLAGYGRDVRGWRKVREGALRGFEMASDGRLYHPLMAEFALKAFRKRRSQSGNARTLWKKRQVIENQQNASSHGIGLADAMAKPSSCQPDARERERERERESKKESAERRTPKPARATRLDPTWIPPENIAADVRALGFDDGQIGTMLDAMRDWATNTPSAKGTAVDWGIRFRNWCRREDPRKIRSKSVNGTEKPNGEKPNGIDELTWRARLGAHKRNGLWPYLDSAPPDDPKTIAPERLLIEFGYRSAQS